MQWNTVQIQYNTTQHNTIQLQEAIIPCSAISDNSVLQTRNTISSTI